MTDQQAAVQEEMEAEVRAGLLAGEKWLPSKYLYDEVGSILFEAICALPEYYLTRSERRILEDNASAIVGEVDEGAWLVELGAGSAMKTQILIQQMLTHRPGMVYCPIDISPEALRAAEANILSRFPEVTFRGIHGDWFEALGRLSSMEDAAKLVAFLGSSIGNLERRDAVGFLRRLAGVMRADDRVLVGTDMVKPADELLPAYDDAAGVTAAFNRNLLVRLNRELGADFDTASFRHEARWDEAHDRVEMHLVALRPHTVRLERLGMEVGFRAGESIHTENSHKFTPDSVARMAREAGLAVKRVWHDDGDRFRLNMLAKA